MYVLGIVGWHTRSHDAAACLVRDGELVAAAEEERFTRKKHAYDSFPHHAARFCLDHENIGLDDVDYVAVGWNLPRHYALRRIPWEYTDAVSLFFPREYFPRTKDPKIEYVDHHRAHASSAYRSSGFGDAAILVVDGQGEDASTSLWSGRGERIRHIASFPIKDSLGYFYETLTKFCGFGSGDPGKLMGLAAYGSPTIDFDRFFTTHSQGYGTALPDIVFGPSRHDEQHAVADLWYPLFRTAAPENTPSYAFNGLSGKFERKTVLTDTQRDLAASGQHTLERIMLHLAETAVREAGSQNLCIAGGVALNCTANGKILRSGTAQKIHVYPASHDAGCSAGAALELSSQLGSRTVGRQSHTYTGPAYSSAEVFDVLRSLGIKFSSRDDISARAAEAISRGKIVGWFQGGMEFGPRTLGHRSILADPRHREVRNRINKDVKSRESFRPFGPSIASDSAAKYLECSTDSPFMLFDFYVRPEKIEEFGAVTHIDGTTRPQTVGRSDTRYYELLKQVERRIGVPAVLNTSFNGRDEPIVCTPYDAVERFFGSPLDYLVLEDFLIVK